jgi:hypothetical protein
MIGISYFGSMQVLANLAENIEIPVYLQIDQGRGWTVDGHIELFHALSGPKKLDIGSYPRCSRAPGSSVRGRVGRVVPDERRGRPGDLPDPGGPPVSGRTPFGVLSAVLLGFVEALLVAAVAPMLVPDAPRLNLLWLVGIVAYGCVMTLILVVVENAVLATLMYLLLVGTLGRWRPSGCGS